MIVISCAAATLALSLPFFALSQLSGYRIVRSKKAWRIAAGVWILAALVGVVGTAFGLFVANAVVYWTTPVVAVASGCLSAKTLKKFSKTPPRVTARFLRLCACCALVGAAEGCAAAAVSFAVGAEWSLAAVGCVCALAPVSSAVALLLVLPIEKALAARWMRKCRRELRSRENLLTVAVTGSYGKTGVKTYLAAMLSARYKVFASPKSFNTPAGMCLSVERMPRDTEIFVAEAGARRRGDIEEICRLVTPTYGLVTGVAAQHLETFGSIDAVYETKRELPDWLTRCGGTCCFNADNALAAKMYDECGCRKLASGNRGDCVAQNVRMTSRGSEFTLVFSDGDRADCRTALLGPANVQNVALAACAAHDLGVSASDIAAVVAKLEPAPHRLQPIEARGMTVIDDSYNANPDGVKNAFDTLRLFEGRRAVATQGIVEGGKKGDELNERLGAQLVGVVDVAIVIGPNADAIERGAREARFCGQLYRAADLEEAKRLFATALDGVSVLLIQNDLPDNY